VLTCSSIPPTAWAHAREALVFYFSRRHGIANAEDLAQDTLAALLSRPDFEFEKEEDFLRVCYGFAGRVSQAGYRKIRKHSGTSFDPAIHDPTCQPGGQGTGSLNPAEIKLLLDEVIQIGQTQLRAQEWEIISTAAHEDGPSAGGLHSSDGGNGLRVRLFRARQKLVKLTRWRKSAT
jgi:hypothetical protein